MLTCSSWRWGVEERKLSELGGFRVEFISRIILIESAFHISSNRQQHPAWNHQKICQLTVGWITTCTSASSASRTRYERRWIPPNRDRRVQCWQHNMKSPGALEKQNRIQHRVDCAQTAKQQLTGSVRFVASPSESAIEWKEIWIVLYYSTTQMESNNGS